MKRSDVLDGARGATWADRYLSKSREMQQRQTLFHIGNPDPCTELVRWPVANADRRLRRTASIGYCKAGSGCTRTVHPKAHAEPLILREARNSAAPPFNEAGPISAAFVNFVVPRHRYSTIFQGWTS